MTESKPPQSPTPPERSEAETHKTSGRIAFDKRGNSVWEWALKTGIFGRDIDTKRLRALEAKDLKIVEEPAKPPAAKPRDSDKFASQPRSDRPAIRPVKDSGGGMNPYDNITPEQRKVPAQVTRPLKPAESPVPERRRSWREALKKLFSGKRD